MGKRRLFCRRENNAYKAVRPYRQEAVKMDTNQFKHTSGISSSQSQYKKVSETKSLKRLKEFLNRQEVIGVDTDMAGINFTADVLNFCQRHNHKRIGRAIYFNGGVV